MGPDRSRSWALGRQDTVPGKGQEATLSHLHHPPEKKAGARNPGRSVRSPKCHSRGSSSPPPASLTPSGAAGAPLGWRRPRNRAGTRTWAFGTPAPRPSHPYPPTEPRAGWPRRPQEAPPERGRGGVARPWRWPWRGASTPAYPWLETGGRGEGRGRSGSLGTGRAGGTSLQVRRARARAGGLRWAAGLAAGLRCGPGWERGAAPPALGAGRAERGPDVSAGGFVRPQPGPNRAAGAPRRRLGCWLPLGPPGEHRGARKPEKPTGGMGREGRGLPRAQRHPSASQRTVTAGGVFAVLVITHCADKDTEARDTDSRIPSVWELCCSLQFWILLLTRALRELLNSVDLHPCCTLESAGERLKLRFHQGLSRWDPGIRASETPQVIPMCGQGCQH